MWFFKILFSKNERYPGFFPKYPKKWFKVYTQRVRTFMVRIFFLEINTMKYGI